jgi:hypothetical protein
MTSTAEIERALITALDTIRTNWDALVEPKTGAGRVGGRSSDSLTGTDMAVSLRHEITLCLNSWCRLIVDENQLTYALPLGTDAVGMCELLQRWARWFSGHEAGADAADELRRCAGRISASVSGNSVARIQVGRCPEMASIDVVEMVPCTGSLWAVMYRSTSLLPKRITCDANTEHAWEPSEWASLGRRVAPPQEHATG